MCLLPTDVYYDIFDSTTAGSATDLAIFNRDFGGTGSIGSMQLPTIAGIPIVTTPHFGSYNSAGTWSNSIFNVSNGNSLADSAPLAAGVGSGRAAAYNLGSSYTATTAGGSNVGADGGLDGTSTVNFGTEVSKIRGFVFSKDACATVKLMDLAVESEYQIDRQGTLIVSKYAMGHDVLRPAMAVALKSA
jgi:hypothetical protein